VDRLLLSALSSVYTPIIGRGAENAGQELEEKISGLDNVGSEMADLTSVHLARNVSQMTCYVHRLLSCCFVRHAGHTAEYLTTFVYEYGIMCAAFARIVFWN